MNYGFYEDFLNKELLNSISSRLSKLDIPFFSYVIYAKQEMSSHAMISNFPRNWLLKYKKEKLYKDDPIIRYARESITPFSWFDDNQTKFEDIKWLEIDRTKQQETVTGYTFTLHDHLNNFAALSVCDIEGRTDFRSLISRYEDKLQMILIEVHQEVVALLAEHIQECFQSIRLTAREKDVLHWACMGKTYEEISIILGIKHVTVKYHAANVCKKINANNIKQAIRKYTELNLV